MTSLTVSSDGCLAPNVILYHTTVFGSTEHSRSTDRADAARARISAWLADHAQLAGLALTTPGAVAWATGGVAPPVDRTAGTDLVWAVFTRAGAGLITTEVEADRVRDEYGPQAHGFADLAVVPWHAPDAFAGAALDLAGAGRCRPGRRRSPRVRHRRGGRPDRAAARALPAGTGGPA